MDLWQYIGGVVTAEITGADLQGTLLEVAKENIEIRSIQQESELTCCMTIDRNACGRLEKDLQKKRGQGFLQEKIRSILVRSSGNAQTDSCIWQFTADDADPVGSYESVVYFC